MQADAVLTPARHLSLASAQEVWRRWIGLVPFFAFITFFLILPSTSLFLGAFRDSKGSFTLANIAVMQNPYVLKSYLISLQVSVITSLVGGVFGFMVAYAVTIGVYRHSRPYRVYHRILKQALLCKFGGSAGLPV
jgi:putative spermidine/putrescine transport system permease protein